MNIENTVTPCPVSLNYHVQVILREKLNQLKARMMNLAEASVTDTRQCNALKGLMKDALNQAYFGSLRDIQSALVARGLDDDCHSDGPIPGLNVNGLADILVD